MTELRRYVIGSDTSGRSRVTNTQISNAQSRDGYFWRSTLWATRSYPPDRSDPDVSASITAREPGVAGAIFRALELAPDDPDPVRHRLVMAQTHDAVGQRFGPTADELARHPGMHRTATIDFVTCVSGEIYLMTDTDEAHMRPGDTAIIRGGNHAWSNRSDTPCLLTVVLLNASHEREVES